MAEERLIFTSGFDYSSKPLELEITVACLDFVLRVPPEANM